MIASYVLLITMGTTLLATAVTSSATLTCLPLCCRSAQQDMVQQNTNFDKEHHQPNEAKVTSVVVNMDQLAALNLPTIEDLQDRSTLKGRKNVTFMSILIKKFIATFQLVLDSSEPPSFQDVGVGSKYQKS